MIKKSYKLIEYGNRNHNLFSLYFMALATFIVVYLSTFDLSCAKLSFKQIKKRNVKSALRRVAWFSRNSYLKLKIIDDDNFDFTEDLELDEVKVVKKFLEKRKTKLKKEIFLTNYLFILSFKLHYYLEKNSLDNAKPLMVNFKNISNEFLERILSSKEVLKYSKKTKKIKSFSNEGNSDFLNKARDILKTFSIHVPKEKYPWYIISGTFLGLVRENGFLKHDVDIDLGINFKDIKNIDDFIKKLKNIPNITIKSKSMMPKIRVENGKIDFDNRLGIIKLVEENGIQIDIFIHYEENDKIVHGSKIHMWANTPYELVKDKFYEIEILRPSNPSLYLSENYGNWQTPVREFNCSIDTPNLTVASNFYSISFFLRRLFFILQGGEEKINYDKILSMLENQKIIIDKKINIPFVEDF
jgi:hypothetical protein